MVFLAFPSSSRPFQLVLSDLRKKRSRWCRGIARIGQKDLLLKDYSVISRSFVVSSRMDRIFRWIITYKY